VPCRCLADSPAPAEPPGRRLNSVGQQLGLAPIRVTRGSHGTGNRPGSPVDSFSFGPRQEEEVRMTACTHASVRFTVSCIKDTPCCWLSAARMLQQCSNALQLRCLAHEVPSARRKADLSCIMRCAVCAASTITKLLAHQCQQPNALPCAAVKRGRAPDALINSPQGQHGGARGPL
jgi:hypothetical protein